MRTSRKDAPVASLRKGRSITLPSVCGGGRRESAVRTRALDGCPQKTKLGAGKMTFGKRSGWVGRGRTRQGELGGIGGLLRHGPARVRDACV